MTPRHNDTARVRVLDRLRAAREGVEGLTNDGWIAAADLQHEDVGGLNGLRRLRELRDDGLRIDQKTVGNESFYRLHDAKDDDFTPPACAYVGKGSKHEGIILEVWDPFAKLKLMLCSRHRHKLGLE